MLIVVQGSIIKINKPTETSSVINTAASYGPVALLLSVVSLFNHMGELVQQPETLCPPHYSYMDFSASWWCFCDKCLSLCPLHFSFCLSYYSCQNIPPFIPVRPACLCDGRCSVCPCFHGRINMFRSPRAKISCLAPAVSNFLSSTVDSARYKGQLHGILYNVLSWLLSNRVHGGIHFP